MVVKELVALLGIKTDKKGFDQAESGLGKVVKIAKAAAAAFAALKVVQFAKGVIEETAKAGDAIDKLSIRSGVTTDNLQGLGHAAELTGASIGDIETSIKRLQSAQVEASEGVSTYADEFKRLGVDVMDAEGNFKDTTALMIEMSDSINGLGSQAEQTQVLMKLFGRSGVNLLPMLKEGSEGIAAMMQEMKDLGGVMDAELIASSALYIDNQRRFDVMVMGMKNAVAKVLLPAINNVSTAMITWWKANGQIIRQHMGTVFGGIGRVIMSNVRFFGRLIKIIYNVVNNLTPLQKAVLGIWIAIKAVGALITAGPIGKLLLLAALIALIIDDFEVWRKGGKSVIGDLMDTIGELLGIDLSFKEVSEAFERAWEFMKQIHKAVFGAIFETVLALNEFLINVWDDPGAAFEKFVLMLESIWGDFGKNMQAAFELFWIDLKGLFTDFWGWLTGSIDDMGTAWSEFWTKAGENYDTFIDSLLGALSDLGKSIANWAKGVIDDITAPFRVAGEFLGILDKKKPKQGLPQEATGNTEAVVAGAKKLLGATATPQGAIGYNTVNSNQSNMSTVYAPTTHTQMDIHATSSMDEKKLSQEIAKQWDLRNDQQNRKAMRIFTHSPAGAG